MSTPLPDIPAWIARTKLHPPRLRADAIERRRLLDALNRAVASTSVTLLSAPAGSGKSTLLSTWLAHLRLETGDWGLEESPLASSLQPLASRVAWLSLDEDDDDPASFLLALIAALRQLNPDCGANTLQWIASGQSPAAEPRRFAGVLINEILQTLPEPFVLVLDDLHALAAPPIFTFLDHLIERMPPQMRVVIATRHEPPLAVGRLRARRQVAELHLDDLRFTSEETGRLLNDTLQLGLSAAHVQLLHARTEGWAAGIGMLAGSLDRLASAEDRGAFLAHVERAGRYVFDFLADEVLGRQDPFVRMFLLETSILPELTPAACLAVTGRSDSAAILDELYRRNLFLVALDDHRPSAIDQRARVDPAADHLDRSSVASLPALSLPALSKGSPERSRRFEGSKGQSSYRYHDLFRDFLRERLARELPEWVRQLHGRAATAEPLPARRIQHYLAAELWGQAADAIEQAGEAALAQGGGQTARGWIEALPPEVRAARPQLLYLLGACARAALEWHHAEQLFEQARDRFVAAGDLAGEGATQAQLATLLLFMAYWPRAIAAARRALECPIEPHQRAQLYITSAWIELRNGHFDRVLADLDGAVQVTEQHPASQVVGGLALLFHSPLVIAPGAIRRIERIANLVNERIHDQDGIAGLIAHALSAHVLCWRGRWQQAAAIAQRIVARGQQAGGLGMLWGVASAHGFLALDAAYHGDDAASDQVFEALFAGLEQPAPGATATWNMFYHLTRARIQWLKGQLGPARAVYAAIAEYRPEPDRWSPALVARPLFQGMIALAEGRSDEAERALISADELQRRDGTTVLLGRAALMLAHLYRATDRDAEATGMIAPILAQCAADDTPGLLLWDGPALVAPLLRLAAAHGVHAEFAQRTLTLIDEAGFTLYDVHFPKQHSPNRHTSPAHADLEEPLTPREVEIVRMLAAGASNQLIAETLVISLHTVKRHVTHILGKLQASSRLEAVARARELRIVP